jgi:hypothetical protein
LENNVLDRETARKQNADEKFRLNQQEQTIRARQRQMAIYREQSSRLETDIERAKRRLEAVRRVATSSH